MLIRKKHLEGLLLAGCIVVAAASCSSSSSNGDGSSPASLVATCDKVCNEVSECITSSVLSSCLSTCSELSGVQAGCLDQLASYLACFVGATSISCQGNSLQISLGHCQSERQDVLDCNAGPSPVSGCLDLSGNTACAGTSPNDRTEFCIGVPTGCEPPAGTTNPLGIGTYCCP
jgi:hypothetical protein